MTTIAYRDGVLAADTRGYSGSRVPIGTKAKIRRLDDGTLVGCSSVIPGAVEAIIAWYAMGTHTAPPVLKENKFSLLVVRPSGEAFLASDNFLLSGPLTAEFFAIGSGEEYAIVAMAMGASAERAAEVGCECDVWSALPVMVLRHAP